MPPKHKCHGRGRSLPVNLYYKCTFDCAAPGGLFKKKKEWIDHEITHRKRWICRFEGCTKKYCTYQDYQRHIAIENHFHDNDAVNVYVHDINGGKTVLWEYRSWSEKGTKRKKRAEQENEDDIASDEEEDGEGDDQDENHQIVRPVRKSQRQAVPTVRRLANTYSRKPQEEKTSTPTTAPRKKRETAESRTITPKTEPTSGDDEIVLVASTFRNSNQQTDKERELLLKIRKSKMEQEAAAIKEEELRLELDKLRKRA